MDRKEFLKGLGVATFSIPVCLGILSSCNDTTTIPAAPTGVDFAVDISTGSLSKNGSYVVKNGILIARTNSGNFIAVSAACTHEGATLTYSSSQNDFYCPRHGATFSAIGKVTSGPASHSLVKYNTSVDGNSLRIFS